MAQRQQTGYLLQLKGIREITEKEIVRVGPQYNAQHYCHATHKQGAVCNRDILAFVNQWELGRQSDVSPSNHEQILMNEVMKEIFFLGSVHNKYVYLISI